MMKDRPVLAVSGPAQGIMLSEAKHLYRPRDRRGWRASGPAGRPAPVEVLRYAQNDQGGTK